MGSNNKISNIFQKNKRAFIGGLIVTLFLTLAVVVIGQISGYEAKKLIASSLPGLNMLCNTIVLASATILALLLTLLGISSGTKNKLKKAHYKQVLNIATIDTILFVCALVLFQLFNIPITETDNVPTTWYDVIYWSTLIVSSMLSGALITVILMLYNTVSNIINIVGLGKDHHLISKEELEEEEEEEQTTEKE
ncbi:hypothetical protein [Marinirhabdus gelatinilytica]|uniref:Uncharacterized protein n=1 Tax=Marinirhabdus gelatinilytica TaxID=1703343 RepID=A0A370QAR5_9FLAO|nr:hypothetical protein [Marinirhabdus gelatinilytica]RDK85468.1 hypothetical protein C8D94_103295 [Marinirhabdus gelatinilytica]